MSSNTKRPAVFLDRDGTLNVDYNYTHRVENLVLISGAAETVKRFSGAGFWTVVVTNQSGIARGYFDTAAYHRFNEALVATLVKHEAHIDLILHCPHHPEITGPCGCRKPKPGLILRAAEQLPIDLSRSLMIGDRTSDVACAEAAGIDGYQFTGRDLHDFCENRQLFP